MEPPYFPTTTDGLSNDEIAMILTKALRLSGIEKKSDLAKISGINASTLYDYFNGATRPSPQRWGILRGILYAEDEDEMIFDVPEKESDDDIDFKCSPDELKELMAQSEELIDAIKILAEKAAYFKDKPAKARVILKERISRKQIGYIVSLLEALYSEKNLEIFKVFTEELE